MALTVRAAEPGDCKRCLELLSMLGGPDGRDVSLASADVFDALVGQERGQVLVAEHEGRVVGMAAQSYNLAMRYGGEYAQLEELIVDPAARGM